MNKTIPYIFSFLLLLGLLIFPQGVFSASGEIKDTETLREMQEKIDSLKSEKEVLDFKWKNFRIGNENLGDLIRESLSESEKQDLEYIIREYTDIKKDLEIDIEVGIEDGEDIENMQKQLLVLKQDFYKSLIPFLQEEKLEGFRKYVESDIIYREKSNEVATQIEKKYVERTERVDELQEHIKSHKEKLYEQITQKVRDRVTQRLDIFITQSKFQELSSSSKIEVFERLIMKIQEKRNTLLNIDNQITSVAQETSVLYEVIEDILYSYIDKWQ